MTTVYPLRTAFIAGVKHVEQDVSDERARELTRWMNGACFTTDPDHPDRIVTGKPVKAAPRASSKSRKRSAKAPAPTPPAVEAGTPEDQGDEPEPPSSAFAQLSDAKED